MRRRPTWFAVSSWIFAALFAVCVVLQHNDPDPARWMAMYGAAAVASILAATWRHGWLAAAVVGAVAAVWAGWLWGQIVGYVAIDDLWLKMSEKGGKVEEMREAGGLTIATLWLATAALLGWLHAREARTP